MSAAALVIASLLLLATTADLALPHYDMAWGEFSHRLAQDPPAPLRPGATRVGLIAAALVLTLLALARALVRLAGLSGKGFAFLLVALLLASGASLVLLPRPGAPPDPATLLYALRALGVCLLVVGAGSLLFPRVPSHLRLRLWDAADRAIGTRLFLPATAAFAAFGVLLLAWVRLEAIPHAIDEITQIFQARIYASGLLWEQPPPLPDLMGHFSVLTEGGKWRSAAPPGHALAMAPFVAAGILPLYPPLITALIVAAVFAFVSRTDGRRTAALAVLLLLGSPWFWAMGASYMSHLPAALWLACFLACFVRAREGSLAAAGGAGLFLGLAAATREADALLLSAPFGLLWLLDAFAPDRRPAWLARSGAMGLGLAPGLGFLLLTNTLANGGPFVFGHDLLFGGRFGFGFGLKPPGVVADPFSTPVHTLPEGLSNFRGLLTDLQITLFGLGIPSLALVALGTPRSGADRLTWAGLTALALYLAAYVYFPLDMTMFGPRYAYGALSLFAWLGARGCVAVHRRLAATDHAFAVPGILVLGTLLAAAHGIPNSLASLGPEFAGVDRHLERALAGAGAREAIVAIPLDPRGLAGNPFLYTSAFRITRPDLRGIVPFRALGEANLDAALDAFPDRPAYVWFPVYDRPFYDTRFVTGSLVRIHRKADPRFRPDREATLGHMLNTYPAAISGGAGSSDLWNLMGTVAWLGDDGRTAGERFRRAIRLGPGNADPWINLALLSLAEGREQEAREAARWARRLGAVLPPPLARILGSESGASVTGPGR